MTADPQDEALVGSRVGAWTLESLVDAGDTDRVYLATREDKGFTQTSALRILRSKGQRHALGQGFTTQRQLLASIEHPCIARFLDGGVTEEGCLWLAAEYVVGLPIDIYVGKKALGLAQCLDLFDQLCDAMAYLHQRLITHGDVSPAKVLVDASGHVRVLEIYRRFAPRSQQSLNTAEDVHAMGGLLAAMLRAVDARSWNKAEQNRDLNAVLSKTQHARIENRYQSVAELRADIRAYRDHRPVRARTQTALYRTSKFLRRHWLGFSATVAAGVSLFVGLTLALWQADRAILERDRAEAMNRFMQEVLAEADPYSADQDRTVRETLVEASALLDERFADQPDLEMALRQTVGGIQVKLRDLDEGEKNLRRVLELTDARVPRDDEIRLRALADLGWASYERDDFAQAISTYRSILELLDDRHPRDLHRLVHNDLGVALNRSGEYEVAVEELKASLAYLEVDDADQRAAVLINLGYAYGYLERFEQAEATYLEAIEILDTLGPLGRKAAYAYVLNNYGRILARQSRMDEALGLYQKSLAVRREVFGVNSDAVGAQMLNVGRLLMDMQRPEQALPYLSDAIEVLEQHRETQSFYMSIARASHARAVLLVDPNRDARDQALQVLDEVLQWLADNSSPRTERFLTQFQEWRDEALLHIR